MERIASYKHKGLEFIYFDMSYLQTNEEFENFIHQAKEFIKNKTPSSLMRSITNVEGIIYDTKTKELVAAWMAHNTHYFKSGAIIGYDGIKRILIDSILKMSMRSNMRYSTQNKEAEAWLTVNYFTARPVFLFFSEKTISNSTKKRG